MENEVIKVKIANWHYQYQDPEDSKTYFDAIYMSTYKKWLVIYKNFTDIQPLDFLLTLEEVEEYIDQVWYGYIEMGR